MALANLNTPQLITAIVIMMSITATTPAPMAIPYVRSCASPDPPDVNETGRPDDETICTNVDVCIIVWVNACETVCVGVNKVLLVTSEQEVADGS